jgi:hypothetical protein
MATGFIYTVTTLNRDYVQEAFCNVPTQFGDRLYFGPCKRAMRPKARANDYVFGLSPSTVGPRRIVFIGHIEERISFREAYQRFPDLRGPIGPVHVEPARRAGSFPYSSYAHIAGAMHASDWQQDLASEDLDAFFVCAPQSGWVGRWLGKNGPEVNDDILQFLKECSVHGPTGQLSATNSQATLCIPIAYGKLYRGLHLETKWPEDLVALCGGAVTISPALFQHAPIPVRSSTRHRCGDVRPTRGCR